MSGSGGYPKDVKKGLELINLVVEQRHPMALYYIWAAMQRM